MNTGLKVDMSGLDSGLGACWIYDFEQDINPAHHAEPMLYQFPLLENEPTLMAMKITWNKVSSLMFST